MPASNKPPILIAGPTASGKSALAMLLAERLHGVVINADSMQVYRELRVLTARPSTAEEAQVPHRLFGHIGAAEPYSVARWLDDVRAALDEAAPRGLRPIIVGGTGLYFKALTEGLAPVPAIPDEVRRLWRDAAAVGGAAALHAELWRRDAGMAARLAPGDTQRITRALEVIDATGRSLADWQAQPAAPVVRTEDAVCLVVERPRAELAQRADWRFERMLDEGAVEEVAALLRLGLAPELPAMRALGVRPVAEMLSGRLSREAASAAGQQETRQYIKRQQTWIKRNMCSWNAMQMNESCDILASIMRFIDES